MHVELFSVPGCTACVGVRQSLFKLQTERSNLQVEEVDLSVHPARGAKYGLLSCPAVAVDGRLELVGAASERKIRKILNKVDSR